MGHKVNPKSYRLGITRTWNSKWFSDKHYRDFLQEDTMIRKVVGQKLKNSGVVNIEIERFGDTIKVIVNAAKPGLIIGRGGAGIDQLKQEISKKVFDKIYNKGYSLIRSSRAKKRVQDLGPAIGPRRHKYDLDISIQEVKEPGLSAQVVLEEIIADLEKRIPFRRVMKQAVERVKKAGARGVKMSVAGRLDGVDIARTEKFAWGNVPLHTLRADIDYARGAARTIYGAIGVKVWIYRGEVFKQESKVLGLKSKVINN